MIKVKQDLCPEITSNIFAEGTNCCYNLHHRKDFRTSLVTSVYHGIESAAILDERYGIMFLSKLKTKHL